MKKLINKKTGEIAYIDLYFNTITFSKSKTTHKISIQKDPNTNQITKITSFPEPIINPISEPFPEPKSEPITNNISSEPSNTSTPNTNNSSEHINNTTSNTHTHKSQSSNTNKPKHKPTNKTINTNHNNSELMDKYLIYEMYPETELFESPDPLNSSFLTPTYKIPA